MSASISLVGIVCRGNLRSLGRPLCYRPLLAAVPGIKSAAPFIRKYQGQGMVQTPMKTPDHLPPVFPRRNPDFTEESDDLPKFGMPVLLGGFIFGILWGRNNDKTLLTASRTEGEMGTCENDFKLFQYQSCPFCCKVRAFLDFYGVPYQVIEVNPVTKYELKWAKENRKVPLLLAFEYSDEIGSRKPPLEMRDSSSIISQLSTLMFEKGGHEELRVISGQYPVLHSEEKGMFYRTKKTYDYPNRHFVMYGESKADESEAGRNEERKWRQWADDVMVHMISPNVYRTMPEAIDAFYHFAEWGDYDKQFGEWSKHVIIYVGAAAMYLIGRKLKTKYGLKEDVRQSLYDAANEWTRALGNKKFMGGNMPNLADLAVYGVLHSMEGLEAFKDMFANTNIGPWYESTKEAVNSHAGKSLNTMR